MCEICHKIFIERRPLTDIKWKHFKQIFPDMVLVFLKFDAEHIQFVLDAKGWLLHFYPLSSESSFHLILFNIDDIHMELYSFGVAASWFVHAYKKVLTGCLKSYKRFGKRGNFHVTSSFKKKWELEVIIFFV